MTVMLLAGCEDETLEGTRYTATVCFNDEPCGSINGVEVGCTNGRCIDPAIGLCERQVTCTDDSGRRYDPIAISEFGAPCQTFDGACGWSDLCSSERSVCITSGSGCVHDLLYDEICDVNALVNPADPQ